MRIIYNVYKSRWFEGHEIAFVVRDSAIFVLSKYYPTRGDAHSTRLFLKNIINTMIICQEVLPIWTFVMEDFLENFR